MEGEQDQLWGWDVFFGELSSFMQSAHRQFGVANQQYTQYVIKKLQECTRTLSILSENIEHSQVQLDDNERSSLDITKSSVRDLISCCRSLQVEWEHSLDLLLVRPTIFAYQAPITTTSLRRRGRPRFDIERDQLEYLASMGFSWTKIADILGVSRMTVYRRRREYGLLADPLDTIDDNNLDRVLRQMRADFPAIGETMVQGNLRATGYRVSREQVRQSIRRTDPLNAALRWRSITPRRPYSVPSPNSLWHIDGHHKLVRWKLVTHGGVDGYSRLVVYLHCSDNNRASTVYSLFLKAVNQHGLPSRVRSDEGGENSLISRHMIECRGADRQSMIVGSSVHNQRIERFWRDMHRCVIQLYYRLFYHLEYEGLLDNLNEKHLYALHFVYLPRINKALSEFKEGWNIHSIRTEHGKTPVQLFTEGVLSMQHSGLAAVDFFDSVNEEYGVEEDGLNVDDAQVNIPAINFQLFEEHQDELLQLIRLIADENFGIDQYVRATQFIDEVVQRNPSVY